MKEEREKKGTSSVYDENSSSHEVSTSDDEARRGYEGEGNQRGIFINGKRTRITLNTRANANHNYNV